MASTIKVNNIQNQCGANIINESANTITIGASGDTIQLAAGATQSGFGRTGTVDWNTTAVTSSPLSAVSGTGYFINTTSGAITVNLPAGSAGAIVSFADYTNTWQTNPVTVAPNGTDKIGGIASNAILSTEGQSVTFVYVDATEGWKNVQDSTSNVTGNPYIVATGGTISYCGNYKIHTFTSPGTFCVSVNAVCATYQKVDYMVVAGGGGGGGGSNGSGGASGAGAGGFRESKCATTSGTWTASPLASATSLPVSVTAYPITIGAGGSGGPSVGPATNANGVSGNNSVFSTITSAGGGAGRGGPCGSQAGVPGGSGGGASGGNPGCQPGGTGNTPPVSPPQGNPGGNGLSFPQGPSAPEYSSAGGGGAGGAGQPMGPGSRAGGVGVSTSITGSPLTKSTGGTGGTYLGNTVPISNEPANSGNGGWGKSTGPGGSPAAVGANGGSGIVVIRYKYQ